MKTAVEYLDDVAAADEIILKPSEIVRAIKEAQLGVLDAVELALRKLETEVQRDKPEMKAGPLFVVLYGTVTDTRKRINR